MVHATGLSSFRVRTLLDVREPSTIKYSSRLLQGFRKLSREFPDRFEALVKPYGWHLAEQDRLDKLIAPWEAKPLYLSKLHHITRGEDRVKTVRKSRSVKPSERDLRNLLCEEMTPVKTEILLLSGHGLPWREELAGLQYSAIAGAVKASPIKSSLVLLDACFGAQLEVLALFAPFQAVVGSQEGLRIAGLPNEKFLETIVSREIHDPKKMGQVMLKKIHGMKGINSLTVADPKLAVKLKLFWEILEKSLIAIANEQPEAKKAVIQALKKGTDCVPEGKSAGLADLGTFLKNIKKAPFYSKIYHEVAITETLLHDTVLSKCATKKYSHVSGISFDTSFLVNSLNQRVRDLF